jgi:hypothetical protein
MQGACYYKNNTGDTFNFWVKKRGSAFSEANCYCYALNRFAGETSKGVRCAGMLTIEH